MSSYIKLKAKCQACGVHFVICTDFPERHGTDTLYCPECGQHDSRFFFWAQVVNGYIFQEVEGGSPLVGMGPGHGHLKHEEIQAIQDEWDLILEKFKAEQQIAVRKRLEVLGAEY